MISVADKQAIWQDTRAKAVAGDVRPTPLALAACPVL